MHRSAVPRRFRTRPLSNACIAALPVLAIVAADAQATTYTVGSNADPATGTAANCAPASADPCTLRDAVAAAVGDDMIVFNLAAGSTTITLTNGQLTLSNVTGVVTIDGTTASGAVAVDGDHASRVFFANPNTQTNIRNLTIQNGSQTGSYMAGSGGGIFNEGNITLTNCTVTGNYAAEQGGGIDSYGGLTLTNSAVSGNSAVKNGGGIQAYGGATTLTNTTVSGNSSTSGAGGGIADFSYMKMFNSTLSGNSAAHGGDGLYQLATSSSTLVNTIMADSCLIQITGAVIDHGGNLDSFATCGFSDTSSKSNATLNLGPLASNGGPTQTVLPGAGSDAINFTVCTNAPPTDQRDYLRPDPANAGLLKPCDAGAVEAGSIPDEIFADGFGPPPGY